ncbi:retrovirus-related pol polyprotein from transposon TNT 1-94 [Tanacetum coccineum]
MSSRPNIPRPSKRFFPPCIHYGGIYHLSNECLYYPICKLCGSYDHDTNGHKRGFISLERDINPRNPQHALKNCEACGSSTHTTTDHYDIEWFKRGEALQAKKAEALKSTRAESSNANRSKTPTKRVVQQKLTSLNVFVQSDIRSLSVYLDNGCLRHMTGVKSYLHKYVEQPGPKWCWDMTPTCTTEGISQNFSSPYTPEQNGVAERKHRTITKAARTMLSGSVFSKQYWTEAVATACYTQNRSHHCEIDISKPLMKLFRYENPIHHFSSCLLERYSLCHPKGAHVTESVQPHREDNNPGSRNNSIVIHLVSHHFDERPPRLSNSTKPLKDNISIAESERYTPDEYLHPYKPYQSPPLPVPSMVTPAPQDRWSQDKHIELVNIIGNPGAGML